MKPFGAEPPPSRRPAQAWRRDASLIGKHERTGSESAKINCLSLERHASPASYRTTFETRPISPKWLRQLGANCGRSPQDHHSRQGEAGQDRREGRHPWPLCGLPDGGGRHSEGPVRRHPADDRRTARAGLGVHGMKRSRVMSSSQPTGEARPDDRQFCDFPGQRVG